MWKEGKQWQRAIKDQFLEVKNPLLHTESPCQGLTYLCEQGAGRREKPIQREVRIRHFLAKPGAGKLEGDLGQKSRISNIPQAVRT